MNQLITCISSFNLNHSPVRQKQLLNFSLHERKMSLGKLPGLAQGHKAEFQTQVNKSKARVLCLYGYSLHPGQEMRDPSHL